MIDKITEILADPVYDGTALQHYSLYSGSPGYILLALAAGKLGVAAFEEKAILALQELVDQDEGYPSGSLAGGLAGVHWLYAFLYRSGLLEEEDYALLSANDSLLQQYSLQELDRGNWDMLHGALGVSYALLYSYKESYEPYFRKVFEALDCMGKDNDITGVLPCYDAEKRAFVKEETDLGLAHGLPSVLKFCIQAYKQGVCKAQSRALAEQIIDFLLQHTNPDQSVAYFSSVLTRGAGYARKSRLGWCYGDLGVGIVLYQAGQALGQTHLMTLATDIYRKAAARRQPEDTNVMDAGICHGSAGVAHLYHRMWHYTQEPLFQETAAYWIAQTLALANHQGGIAGYMSYAYRENPWTADPGLLEGAAGIGLVLYSYITGDFSWDYCILLND